MRFTIKTSARFVAFLALIMFVPAVSRADDAVKPVQVVVTAAKSLDSAGKFIKDLGLDVPPFLTGPGIEQILPFFGQGGLVTDQPIGIAFFAAPGMEMDKAMVFVFPVKATAATPDMLKGMGAQPMPGHPDTYVIGGQVGLRRTANYLLMSPNPELAASMDADAVANAVKDPQTLVRITGDIRALRTAMPELLPKLLDKGLEGKQGPDREGAEMAAGVVKQFYTIVDRVDLSLHVGEQGAKISLAISPLPLLAAPLPGNRPAMPADIIGRLDLGVAQRDANPAMQGLLTKLSNQIANEPGKNYTDEQKKQIAALIARSAVLWFDPASLSVGVQIADGNPVIYVAEHWTKQIDFVGEMREIMAGVEKFKKPDAEKDIEVQNYDLNGEKVTRFAAKEGGKVVGHLDVVQKGADVLMEAGPGEAKHIELLLAAAAHGAGPETAVMSMWVDLGKLFDQVGKLPDGPLAGLPPEMQKQIAELVANQKVHVELSKVGDGVTFDIKISQTLLANIPKLVAIFKPK
jgi:hypothetical protein